MISDQQYAVGLISAGVLITGVAYSIAALVQGIINRRKKRTRMLIEVTPQGKRVRDKILSLHARNALQDTTAPQIAQDIGVPTSMVHNALVALKKSGRLDINASLKRGDWKRIKQAR